MAEETIVSADPLYLSALACLGASAPAGLKTEVPHNSIAVLPFVNISGEPAEDQFTDGLTEDIITDLSNVSGFLVIARIQRSPTKANPLMFVRSPAT